MLVNPVDENINRMLTNNIPCGSGGWDEEPNASFTISQILGKGFVSVMERKGPRVI